MIVVASNDNESSQVTLPGLSICVSVPVIRGLNTVVFSQCLRQFCMKRAKEANIIATRISLDVGFRELKNAL